MSDEEKSANIKKSDFFNIFADSLLVIMVTTVVSIIYGFIVRRVFTLAYVFGANFLAGAIIILAAVIMMILPVRLNFGKLIDHTTYAERYMERRREKQGKAYRHIFLGMLVIILTGLIQLALAVLIPG